MPDGKILSALMIISLIVPGLALMPRVGLQEFGQSPDNPNTLEAEQHVAAIKGWFTGNKIPFW